MQFSKPFPDELAITHLYRNLALNDTKGSRVHVRSASFAKVTRSQCPSHCPHPWTALYLHQIMAHLSGMTPQTYRAQHTTLTLTRHWQNIYSEMPVKHSKVNVYAVDQFCQASTASASPFRLCQQCRDEDLHSYVMTYWHREHHIAGSDICPKHQTPLEQVGWHRAFSAPNPLTVQGELPGEALILASSHPILVRYQKIALRAMRKPGLIQYSHAHEHLLKRAIKMGLCRRQLSHTGTSSYWQHEIPQYVYSQLPRAWLGHHFATDFLDPTLMPPDTCQDSYHLGLQRLGHSGSARPMFLLLALATLFESTEQICALLFDQIMSPCIRTKN